MDIFRFNTYVHIVNILFSIVTITNALIFFYCLRVHRRVFGLYDDWEHIHKPRYVNRYFLLSERHCGSDVVGRAYIILYCRST